mmetsp:Transcript_59470/g.106116  ORF Transcript_59470/g.106116 Transcript_59470/m.106116 type:complete len:273 (+) Transcript_59470:304-1122(+)
MLMASASFLAATLAIARTADSLTSALAWVKRRPTSEQAYAFPLPATLPKASTADCLTEMSLSSKQLHSAVMLSSSPGRATAPNASKPARLTSSARCFKDRLNAATARTSPGLEIRPIAFSVARHCTWLMNISAVPSKGARSLDMMCSSPGCPSVPIASSNASVYLELIQSESSKSSCTAAIAAGSPGLASWAMAFTACSLTSGLSATRCFRTIAIAVLLLDPFPDNSTIVFVASLLTNWLTSARHCPAAVMASGSPSRARCANTAMASHRTS